MYLKSIELSGFKSFARKTSLIFNAPVTSVVGPNGSGKSNVAEAFRWVLGEQALSNIRGKRGEDFIFNGSTEAARLNHASVAIYFDNSKRQFAVESEEIVIARHVYRDGTNEYYLNQSKVRLMDIVELMASVGLGSSSHYIISQGEADRMLSVNQKERMKMVEDALGLTVFEIKRKEAGRKLDKTQENLKQVEALRREIVPHLKYLKKQVEQIERAEAMKSELKGLYRTYFASEDAYLKLEHGKITEELKTNNHELGIVEKEIEKNQGIAAPDSESKKQLETQLLESERTLGKVRATKDELSRTIGRLEGTIESEENSGERSWQKAEEGKSCPVCGQLVTEHSNKEKLEALWFAREAKLRELKTQKLEADKIMLEADRQSKILTERIFEIRKKIALTEEQGRVASEKVYSFRAKKQEFVSNISLLKMREEKIHIEINAFKRECGEAAVLIGRDVLDYEATTLAENVPREVQETRKHSIERLKIRIEEIGGGHSDVLKEYQELNEREQYLVKEIADLNSAIESLQKLMADLITQLKTQFKTGFEKINTQFNFYFNVLFGGGSAELSIIALKPQLGEDEPELGDKPEEGIEISVSLPRKKIRGLQMLSGGERTLTSLALLFAVTQVNPPPFLILDETDAALDEANSKKYGDMLEGLAKKSQLVIITHNRETMSHAGVLYGITMGKDAVSRVLSIKFEEAEQMAAR
ncbi:MAG: AAA family ATPase [Candidatus Vogelbacteria bacterium]|nr:AAA family ATPase [Candidatus Vogelbacteria bacterium]